MAQAIRCDTPVHGDDVPEAILVITNVPEAEVSGLCLDCSTGFAMAWLQAFAPDMLAPPPAKTPAKPRARKPPATTGGEKDGATVTPRPRPAASKRPAGGDTSG